MTEKYMRLQKVWIVCMCLFASVQGQRGTHRSYDWRMSTTGKLEDWPKLSSLIPFGSSESATESYPDIEDSRYQSYNSKQYPDPDSYLSSAEMSPYKYFDYNSDVDQSISAPYGSQSDSAPMNVGIERIGGFAGTGDTQGFGAYEHKKAPKDDIFPEGSMPDSEITELIKLNRRHRMRSLSHDPILMPSIHSPL